MRFPLTSFLDLLVAALQRKRERLFFNEKMACQAVQTWSLSGLAAAFLDLAISYLLLCASAVAYLASNFLGFFGLNLPCPCDGTFFNINGKILCLNRLLLDFPAQKASDVHLSVKQKFPLSDPKKHDYSLDGDYNSTVNGILEMEGEASCSSVSDARRTVDLVRKEMIAGAGKYDMKGKGVISNRPRSRLRHRKYSSCDSPSVHSSTKGGNRFIEAHYLQYDDNKDPTKMGVRQRSMTGFEMNYSPDANMHQKKIYIEEVQDYRHGVQNLSGDEKTLEEEGIFGAALYIELEKERSAAASAADEAMAMILRLQEEKASIEIEARQYQRILEEKSAYDAEEMNILKEILVRSEKERLFLEKVVEAYRQQMVSVGNERLASDDAGSGKSVVFTDKPTFEPAFVRKTPVPMDAKGLEQIPAEKIIVTCNGTETGYPFNYDPSLKQESKDELLEFRYKGPQVYDVHVIGDGINLCNEASSGDHIFGLPPIKPRGLSSLSLSAVESEMLKN